jgi:hypothetical protein
MFHSSILLVNEYNPCLRQAGLINFLELFYVRTQNESIVPRYNERGGWQSKKRYAIFKLGF